MTVQLVMLVYLRPCAADATFNSRGVHQILGGEQKLRYPGNPGCREIVLSKSAVPKPF